MTRSLSRLRRSHDPCGDAVCAYARIRPLLLYGARSSWLELKAQFQSLSVRLPLVGAFAWTESSSCPSDVGSTNS